MPEIYMFPVVRGQAQIKPDGGLRVTLHYDAQRKPLTERLKADPEFGFRVYDSLVRNGYASIATQDNPLRSPSGGAMYILGGGTFFSHRRDNRAPTHPLQHSIQGGFPSNRYETVHTEDVIKREGSELVLVTKDGNRLILPHDPVVRHSAFEVAKKIGLDPSNNIVAKFEFAGGPDVLEIYDGDTLVNSISGYAQLLWEAETALNFLQPCYITGIHPEEVKPIDTEGMEKDGRYIHFNRETFVFRPEHVSDKRFGDRLENPTVYKSSREGGYRVPVLQAEEPADAPYTFMPDDMLSRMLYGLRIWEGDWLKHFRDFHKKVVDERT